MANKSSRWTLKEQEDQRKAAEKRYPRVKRKKKVQAEAPVLSIFRSYDVQSIYPKPPKPKKAEVRTSYFASKAFLTPTVQKSDGGGDVSGDKKDT